MTMKISMVIEQGVDGDTSLKLNGVEIAKNGKPHPRYKGIPKAEAFAVTTWNLARKLLTEVEEKADGSFTVKF